MKINWTHIIIHHSFTEDSKTVSWDAIRKYHVETQKWADIGYHFGIEMGPNGEYLLLTGRPLNQVGAHCKEENMNKVGIGFCFVGNFDLAPPPTTMFVKGAHYVKSLMDVFGIIPSNVRWHRDYATYKSCPGTQFDMAVFRDLLKG